MTTKTAEKETQLIPLEGLTPAMLFDPKLKKMDSLLKDLEKAALAVVTKADTDDDRKHCTRHKNKVVAIEKFFHAAKISETKELKLRSGEIDAIGKKAADKCEELKEIIMKPRKDWEVKETKRQADHNARLAMIVDKRGPTGHTLKPHLAFLKDRKTYVDGMTIDKAWQEFEDKARSELQLTKEWIAKEIVDVEKAIKDHDELMTLRADEIKRKAVAAQIASEAVKTPTASTQGPPNTSGNANSQTFGAGDGSHTIEHRGTINRAILAQFIGLGMNPAMSRELITLMAKGKINHVKIEY